MGLLSRLFSKREDDPAPTAASTPPDDDIFLVPEAIRQFMIEQHGFDPMKNPLRPSVVCPEEYARRVEEQRKQEELKCLEPGKLMSDGTIYLGRYRPKDRDGKSLAKTFNVFAAPEDLPEIMTYNDTVKHISGLKKWHGYDGTNYATDGELYAALKDGSYTGGWIIPTCNVLYGQNVDGNNATPNNILAHMDKGLFKGTFKMIKSRIGSDFPGWYWSSTESRDDLSRVWVACLSVANGGWGRKDAYRSSCRPVRLVEVKRGA